MRLGKWYNFCMKRKIIVGNWKMEPTTLIEAKRICNKIKIVAGKLKSTYVTMCPPSIYISSLISKNKNSLPKINIGAQNVYYEEHGAFTGEISPAMLKDMGVTHVILGHSERRNIGETDEIISKKVQKTLEFGIHPIVCVGEKERDAHGLYLETLKAQIKNSISKAPKKLINQLIIAYEPIWAIGAKEAMDPAIIHEMSLFVKKVLSDIYGHDSAINTPVLYGGSVNFRNAIDIINKGQVDGLLIGRESVNIPGFIELLKEVDKV